MAEAIDFGAGKLGPFVNAGVGVRIEHDDVPGPCKGGDRADVSHIAGGEGDGRTRAEESAELPLEGGVPRVGAVGEAGTRGPRSVGAHGLGRSLDAGGIKGQAEVVIRAGQDDALAFNLTFRRRPRYVDGRADGVDAELAKLVLEVSGRI